MRSFGLATILSFICFTGTARADETIEFNLPAFPKPQSAESAVQSSVGSGMMTPKPNPASQVQSKGKAVVSRRGNPRGAAELSIGRLGMATGSTSIYQRRTSRSRTLSKVPNGTYLALTAEKGDWFGILMADRTTGWMKKSSVKLLDYEVVSNEPIGSPAGGGAVLAGGYQNILQTAYHYLGVPYKWGGTADNGMDCSAFVRKCFQSVGISLPRTSREQINVGMDVPADQLQACDRLYFANRSGTITHTGIYIGDGYFIHSSSSRGGVAVSRLNEPMYRRMFAGARR